jgi:curved DNA-binding protein CbpA
VTVGDYFALLDEPRRPWLDAAALKEKFLARSSATHPDKCPEAAQQAGAARSFAALNAAYQCLAEPKSRLRHLLELERGSKPPDIERIPPALADLFAEVSATCRGVDDFLAEKSQATSPLVRVRLFERGQAWMEQLNALQKKLNDLHGQLMDRLKVLDGKWADAEARPKILPKIEELYRLFGYFNRWHKQIQERVVPLMI